MITINENSRNMSAELKEAKLCPRIVYLDSDTGLYMAVFKRHYMASDIIALFTGLMLYVVKVKSDSGTTWVSFTDDTETYYLRVWNSLTDDEKLMLERLTLTPIRSPSTEALRSLNRKGLVSAFRQLWKLSPSGEDIVETGMINS